MHTIDLQTVLLLALVLWLDGWRRLPPGAILLRRTLGGGWKAGAPWARVGPFSFVGLWPPVVMPLAVSTGDPPSGGAGPRWSRDFAVSAARARRRLRRIRIPVAAMRVGGTILVGWIAVGIPASTATAGVHGLLFGIGAAFFISAWLAFVAAESLREVGTGWRRTLRVAFPLLSPFTATRAPEVAIEAALDDGHPLARLAALLEPEEFRAWLRPHAYDTLHARAAADEPTALDRAVAALPQQLLRGAVAPPRVEDAGDHTALYCPRCTTAYRASAATCLQCDEVELRPLAGETATPAGR